MEEIICSQNINSTISCYSMDFSGNKKKSAPWGGESPSEDVCREVVIFSRKVLKDRVERTGRSRQDPDAAMDGNWSRARTD